MIEKIVSGDRLQLDVTWKIIKKIESGLINLRVIGRIVVLISLIGRSQDVQARGVVSGLESLL